MCLIGTFKCGGRLIGAVSAEFNSNGVPHWHTRASGPQESFSSCKLCTSLAHSFIGPAGILFQPQTVYLIGTLMHRGLLESSSSRNLCTSLAHACIGPAEILFQPPIVYLIGTVNCGGRLIGAVSAGTLPRSSLGSHAAPPHRPEFHGLLPPCRHRGVSPPTPHRCCGCACHCHCRRCCCRRRCRRCRRPGFPRGPGPQRRL